MYTGVSVCVCSHNRWYSRMLLTEVNGSSRQGVPVELRDEWFRLRHYVWINKLHQVSSTWRWFLCCVLVLYLPFSVSFFLYVLLQDFSSYSTYSYCTKTFVFKHIKDFSQQTCYSKTKKRTGVTTLSIAHFCLSVPGSYDHVTVSQSDITGSKTEAAQWNPAIVNLIIDISAFTAVKLYSMKKTNFKYKPPIRFLNFKKSYNYTLQLKNN